MAGKNLSTEDITVNISLIACPLYVVTCFCIEKEKGVSLLESVLTKIEESITARDQGKMAIKMAPRAVTEDADKELSAALMDKVEQENPDRPGDDDNGEEE